MSWKPLRGLLLVPLLAHGAGRCPPPGAGRLSSLPGRVLRAGQPVPRARVWRFDSSGLPATSEETRTDAQGRFVFHDVLEGPATLVAQEGEDSGSAPVQVWASDPPDAGADVELRPGGRLTGHVRDRHGPVAGAGVYGQTRGAPGGGWLGTRTGPDGAYTLRGVWPGQVTVRVEAPLHGPWKAEAVRVRLSEPTTVEVLLESAATVQGQVVDAHGQRVSGALVQGSWEGWTVERREARTDAEGRFTLDGIVPGSVETLSVAPRDFLPATMPVRAPAVGVQIVLRAGGRVLGTVVRAPGGTPVKGAALSVVATHQAEGSFTQRHWEATTDDRGEFQVAGLLPDTYHVELFDAGEGGRLIQREVTLAGPGSEVSVQIALKPVVLLSGRVVDGNGHPLRRAELRDGAPIFSVTDADGRFCGETAPAATHTLHGSTFEGVRLQLSPAQVTAAGSPLLLTARLEEEAVQGRVVREDGTPVQRFRVQNRNVADPDGRFTIALGSTDRVFIEAPGLARYSRRLPPEQKKYPVPLQLGDCVLPAGRTVKGRVIDAGSGKPVPDVPVTATPETYSYDSLQGSVWTDARGEFVLHHVSPEMQTVQVGTEEAPTRVTLAPGSESPAPLEIRIPAKPPGAR